MAEQNNKANDDLPFVSVVVIGKNEERNLKVCFRSIYSMDYPRNKFEVIYVDTDSSDRSVDIARGFNIRIAEEHSDFTTPGLARNRGIKEAKYDIIHFVDGDMTVDKTYLKQAVRTLGENNIACVLGRVTERKSQESLLAKVLNYPWRSRKAGFVDAPGAGGTFLSAVLREVGGYNPSILKGQETELGFRLRKKGYQIYMMERPMGTHDYEIDNIIGAFRHFFVIGNSLGKLLTLPTQQSYADFRRRAKNLLIQGLILTIVILLAVTTERYALLLTIPFALAIWVIIRYWKKHHGFRDRFALGYYLMLHYAKPIVCMGMISFFWKHIVRDKLSMLSEKSNVRKKHGNARQKRSY